MASPEPDPASAANAQLPTSKRACDLCRARKVRCDKETPCSACKTLKVSCTTTPTNRVKRKRVHVSADYESKFNDLQAKLDNLVRGDGDHRPSNGTSGLSEHAHDQTTPASGMAESAPFTKESVEETRTFEGGTSMKTHTSYARDLLRKAIADVPLASSNPAMASAMASLEALTEQSSMPQESESDLERSGESERTPGQITLPPAEAVLDLLRRCRETATWMFSSPFRFLTISELSALCKDVFFAVEKYPISTAVLVHGHLSTLFQEFALGASSEKEKAAFIKYSKLSRDNLESSISSLPLVMQDTRHNVVALVLACSHATMTSRPSLAFKLNSAAATMCLSLGWHRAVTYVGLPPDQRKSILFLFWSTYNMDKNLSIRLGRAAILQDYDIDTELPDVGAGPRDQYNAKMLAIWVITARLQGQMYQRLYSPSALKTGPYVGDLFDTLASLHAQHKEIDKLHDQFEFAPSSTSGLRGAGRMLLSSYILGTFTTEVMIHRALNNHTECLTGSRAALDLHLQIARQYQSLESYYWSMYLTFISLQLPYAPFIVVFCNVLATSNLTDLQRLEDYTGTLEKGETTGLKRLHTLCNIFCQVARLYVEARQTSTATQETGEYDNLFDNVNVNLLMMDNTLGGWYESQQLFTGLLDDTSYLQ